MTPISSMFMRLGNVIERHGKNNSMYHYNIYKNQLVPMQSGDAPDIYTDSPPFGARFGFKTFTSLMEGLRNFADWYKQNQREM